MLIPVNYILMFVLILMGIPLLFYYSKENKKSRIVYLMFSLILVIALVSIVFSDDTYDERYKYYSLFITWCTVSLAFLYSKTALFKTINPRKAINMVSILLTGVFVIYTFWWLFIFDAEPKERLTGILGVSSVLHVPMVLVLAVHLSNIATKTNRLTSIIGAFVTITTILLTNSRAGLLSMGLLFLFFLTQRISIKKITIASVLICTCLFIIMNISTTDRYQSFDDPFREENMRTALSILTSSAKNFMFGSGYGSVWPYDFENYTSSFDVMRMIYTPFGGLLHHAHSVFLEILVELGLIGLLIFILILLIVVHECFKSKKYNNLQRMYILFGVLCVVFPAFFVDLYLFRNWEISLIWWFYLFFGLSYPLTEEQRV
jgi:hypothetical protein